MALRGLARRALHRWLPVHLPPQPLVSFSSGIRGHIFLRFSTSSDQPHFMVDYLVSTCGLPPDKAAKAAPRFAHLSSPARPDAALAFLRSRGLTRAQARAVVSWNPAVLLSDVDATIAPKFRAVRSLGLTRAEAARLFALYPPALSMGVNTNLLPRLLLWLDLLGSARLLMKWLAKTWLLRNSVDAILQNLGALRGHGVPEARLAATVRLKPSLILQSPAKLRALAARVDACGVPRGSRMYAWALLTLHNVSDAAFRAKRAAVMRGTGCTEQEFLTMFRRAPCFLFMSAELLRRKVEFLVDTIGCGADHVVRDPVLLTLSLSKRMVPRCRAIEALKARGVDIGKERLVNIVRASEARFVERYILRYSDQAPELLEMYPPGHHKGSSRGDCSTIAGSCSSQGFVDPSTWRHFDSRAFGINLDAIPKDALFVLKKLRREGFEAYLVGGCVRDLLLKRVPKDFDVITTASLQQIKKNIFRRCMIVGRRFPICLLKMNDSVIEVSSFRTVGKRAIKSKEVDYLEELNGYDDGDILRCKNSMRRDFTINGLFFNPMNYKIYDYVNGVRDMRKNKVCTVVPAHISFMEDPARILRGLRIAARLGFQFSSDTSNAIHDLSSSIINIDKARLTMEMNYIMSYGAAEPSVRLLRKYGLLDILLPFQAAYLSDQMKGRSSDKDLMLMKLLANLDRLFSADRPCHCSLWMALLVFHTALVISPQDTLVIRAFAALLYFGSWESAIEFLKEEEAGAQVPFVPETLGPSQTKLDDLMEQTSHLASLVNSSVLTLTCSDALEQSLVRFSEPP